MGADILVFVETREGKIKKSSFELLSEGRRLSSDLGGGLKAVMIGKGISGLVSEMGAYGVEEAYVADLATFEAYNPETYTSILKEAVEKSKAAILLGTASSTGKDLLPRAAARLDAGMMSECTALKVEGGALVGTRPIFAGKVFVDAKGTGTQVVTCRANVFETQKADSATTPKVTEVGAEAAKIEPKAKIVEVLAAEGGKMDVAEAPVVVGGGRSLKSGENFAILQELADVLGGAVGATRAAVDAGYVPHSYQVGQTGKTINPKLYIGCGVSGAIQHWAGIQTSKVIVAVNTDPNAPIFSKATYGIVGDLFEVVPLLTASFKKLLAE